MFNYFVFNFFNHTSEIIFFKCNSFSWNFFYIFQNGFDFKKQNFDDITSYFEKGPYNLKSGLDYVGGVTYEPSECFWFMHKISDIINAIINAGIEVQEFEEYSEGNMDSEAFKLLSNTFPRSYILIGSKK